MEDLFFLEKVCGFSKLLWKMSLEEFEKIFQKKILRKGAQFSKLFWKLLRKNLGKCVGKHEPCPTRRKLCNKTKFAKKVRSADTQLRRHM